MTSDDIVDPKNTAASPISSASPSRRRGMRAIVASQGRVRHTRRPSPGAGITVGVGMIAVWTLNAAGMS